MNSKDMNPIEAIFGLIFAILGALFGGGNDPMTTQCRGCHSIISVNRAFCPRCGCNQQR